MLHCGDCEICETTLLSSSLQMLFFNPGEWGVLFRLRGRDAVLTVCLSIIVIGVTVVVGVTAIQVSSGERSSLTAFVERGLLPPVGTDIDDFCVLC